MYHFQQDKVVPKRGPTENLDVEGPFYVTNQCLICALPVETAPHNIKWHYTENCQDCPNSCHIAKQPENDEELNLVLEAMHGSCVEAIRYRGTDPQVLTKLSSLGLHHLCDAL